MTLLIKVMKGEQQIQGIRKELEPMKPLKKLMKGEQQV
jgi:hypothetical protein